MTKAHTIDHLAETTMGDYVLSYETAARLGPGAAGGKGWNLGRLAEFGFPVPAGGVLAADAYRMTLADPEVAAATAPLAALGAARAADRDVAALLDRARSAIEARGLPDVVRRDLEAFLERAGLSERAVAVRSSATVEDGRDASFAGIHGSVLSVTGADDVCRAVAACYASLWTPQALAYRRRLGLEDASVACAVVVCEMVGGPGGVPAAAGVAFSADPQSGRRDEVVIEAVPGLGDALVSGKVAPERRVVRFSPGFVSNGAVVRGSGEVLSESRARELARLVRRVEWALGDGQDPQDVEWAFDGDRLWLVQARPVTKLRRVTFPEVAHLPVVWSNTNLKEVVPGVQTPLSWDTLRTVLRACLFKAMIVGDFELPEGLEVVHRINGRAYFDLTTIVWFSFDLFGTTPKEFNESMGGRQPEIPIPGADRALEGAAGRRRTLARLKLIRKIWRFRSIHPRRAAETLAVTRREREADLASLSDERLLDAVRDFAAVTIPYSLDFQLATTCFSMWSTLLIAVAEKARPGAGQRIASGLMAGSGGVVSAEQGYRLFDVVRAAARDPDARAMLSAQPLDPTAWRRLPDQSPFKFAFAAYIDEFGHRAINESEISKPRWREDPTYPLERVRDLLESGRTEPPLETARATRSAAEAAVASLPLPARIAVRWLASRTREGSAMREYAKSTLVSCVEPIAAAAREVGRRLEAAGVIERAEDVFYLSWGDLEAYLRREWDGGGAHALVAARRARCDAWRAETAEDIYVLDVEGHPAELPTAAAAPAETGPATTGRSLVGVGAAAGRATGIARVVMRPEEGSRLADGEVLVAPSTDPAWTPLFLRAAAVVTEVGGYLSHGAIVAREYGLPAVVNVEGVIARVRDGATIVVDGDAGRVELLDEA